MASEEDSPSDGTSSPAASTSQEPQATPLDASDNLMCPICQDSIHDQASVSWCGHLFCYACILEWSRRRAVCPICRWPFYYIYRKVGDDTYVVYDVEPSTSSASHPREGTPGPRSAEMNRHHSPGRQPRSDRGGGRAEAPERGRSRSPRWHDNGPSRVQHAWGYDPSSSSRRPQSRAQDTARNTARDDGRAPRPERDVPVTSGRSDRHERGGRLSVRERQATGSRSRHRSRSPWRQTWQEQERRRDHRQGRALSPEEQVPAYSRWSDHHQWEEGASVRERQATSSRSRRISSSPEHPTRWEQPRRRDLYEGSALSPERQVPASSGRTEHRRWEGQVSIRERQATSSRSRHRSRSPRRRTWREQERRRDHEEGRALSPEEQVPAYPRWSDHHQWEGGASVRERQATSSRSRHRSRSPWRQTWREQERRRDHRQG
nr:serine/arginine repetitive matrix protein 2-like [Columba livia]